jgi:phosphoribosylformylglycinamidine cyclo-ligase
LKPVNLLRAAGIDIRGLAHITGGGFIDNLPRILPDNFNAFIERGTWPELPIFSLIQREGNISDDEMFHVFNMGLGMLVVLPGEAANQALELLPNHAYIVGKIVAGEKQVIVEPA